MKARHAIAFASVLATAFAGTAFAADAVAVKSRAFADTRIVQSDDRGTPAIPSAGTAVRHAPAVTVFGRDGLKSSSDVAVRVAGDTAARVGRDVPQTAVAPVVRRSADVNAYGFGRS